MATVKTFDVKNGLSVSNTIVISNTSGVLNVSNITQMNVGTLNVSNPIAQFANNGLYLNGTFVANNPNINFVSGNTSNISIVGVSNTSPGNVTFTFDTQSPSSTTLIVSDIFTVASQNQNAFTLTANAGNEGYLLVTRNGLVQLPLADYSLTSNNLLTLFANCNINDVIEARVFESAALVVGTTPQVGNVYSNAGLVLAQSPNLVFYNSASVLLAVTANGPYGVNITPSLNTTLNLTTLNVSANIANAGNIIVSQNGIFGNIQVASNIANTGNLSVTQNTTTGNLKVTTLANTATLNASNFGVSQNGTVGILGVSNINFNNTSTVTWVLTPNGVNQINIAATSSGSGGAGDGNTTVQANGTLVLANAPVNFNNTTSINVSAAANGTTTSNVAFNINTSMNLVSLNVSGNISNTGNLLVTQNTFTGNDIVTQNSSIGNLSVTQNTTTGNLSVTTLANVVTLNVSANISNVGNLLVTQNITAGNLSITTNISAGNATVNGVNFLPSWTALTLNASSALAGGWNVWASNASYDTAGYWRDPFGIVHLRGVLSNGTASAMNISFANSNTVGTNIANGLPAPTTQLLLYAGGIATGNGLGNVIPMNLFVYTNGAIQIQNVVTWNSQAGNSHIQGAGTAANSWNLAAVSLYGFTYSTH